MTDMVRQDIYCTRYTKAPSDFRNINTVQEHCIQDLHLGNYISPASAFSQFIYISVVTLTLAADVSHSRMALIIGQGFTYSGWNEEFHSRGITGYCLGDSSSLLKKQDDSFGSRKLRRVLEKQSKNACLVKVLYLHHLFLLLLV